MIVRTEPHYAGFWRRLAATAIDVTLYTALVLPLLYLAYRERAFPIIAGDNEMPVAGGVVDVVLTKLMPVVVLVAFWVKSGATPGKVMMDCQIVDARSFGPISWRQALLRVFGYIVSSVVLYLGFVWIAFDKRKQGWHDKIAKTVVVHRESDYALESRHPLVEVDQ